MRRGTRRPTLTLITGGGRKGSPTGVLSLDDERMICRGIEHVLAEPIEEIFSVDLAHFIGELRSGYRDILMDVVEDGLYNSPCKDLVKFEGTGTFVLDWDAPPRVRLNFIWRGPWYSVVFGLVREGLKTYCTLDRIEADPPHSIDDAAAHLLNELWSIMGRQS